MVCRVIKKNNMPIMFDELKAGDIFIEDIETVPYMKVDRIDCEESIGDVYNAVCLMDGTWTWFEPYDKVFKYNRDIVLNAEDFVGNEGEG